MKETINHKPVLSLFIFDKCRFNVYNYERTDLKILSLTVLTNIVSFLIKTYKFCYDNGFFFSFAKFIFLEEIKVNILKRIMCQSDLAMNLH